jgi:hypothetical protein
MAGRAMTEDLLTKVQNLLVLEGGLIETLANSEEAKDLSAMRTGLLARIREIGKSEDLSLIVATEKAIIEARRDNMLEAGKIYAQRQARTLDVSED